MRYVEETRARSSPSGPVTLASRKATRLPPAITSATHSSSSPGLTALRKLIFISGLATLTNGPGPGDRRGAHGRVGEGGDEAALDHSGGVGEALIRGHRPRRATGRRLVDAAHAEREVAVGRDLDVARAHRRHATRPVPDTEREGRLDSLGFDLVTGRAGSVVGGQEWEDLAVHVIRALGMDGPRAASWGPRDGDGARPPARRALFPRHELDPRRPSGLIEIASSSSARPRLDPALLDAPPDRL